MRTPTCIYADSKYSIKRHGGVIKCNAAKVYLAAYSYGKKRWNHYLTYQMNQTHMLRWRIECVRKYLMISQARRVCRENSFLYKMIERDTVPSLLLFGPPGCGKTTIASVIAKMTKFKFLKLNATSSGAKEIRDIVPAAQKNCSTMEEELLYSSMKFTDLIGHSRIYYCLMWKMGLSY